MRLKRDDKKAIYLFLRYLALLLVALPNLYLFYAILTPITIHPVNFILSLFYNSSVSGHTILVNGTSIEIIEACVAGSAFYLLLVLNLALPIGARKHLYSILFSFALFLAINISRITVFSVLFLSSFSQFDFTHKLFWYVLSSVIVFGVWILTIKVYSIKEIPLVDDVRFILSHIKSKKKRR
jgi:exosortase/archaeosortase family protein